MSETASSLLPIEVQQVLNINSDAERSVPAVDFRVLADYIRKLVSTASALASEQPSLLATVVELAKGPAARLTLEQVDALWGQLSVNCPLRVGDLYMHHKSLNPALSELHAYQVVDLALTADRCQPVVLYADIHGSHRRWVRLLDDFTGKVDHLGKSVQRFQHIGSAFEVRR